MSLFLNNRHWFQQFSVTEKLNHKGHKEHKGV